MRYEVRSTPKTWHTCTNYRSCILRLVTLRLCGTNARGHRDRISSTKHPIFLWLPYANIFTTGPPVFVNAPFRLGTITNCSVETVSHHFSFL